MDKMKLSQEQLKELRYFIYKRGFREPEVMMEILDHFACKVEDKLSAKPGMSLEDAMKEAHNEFGYNGFYNIKASLDVFTRRRYKNIYWSEVKAVLSNIRLMIMLIGLGYAVYATSVWAFVNKHTDWLFEENVVGICVWLVMLIVELYKLSLISKDLKKSYHTHAARMVIAFTPYAMWMFLPTSMTDSPKRILLSSLVIALIAVCFTIHYIASVKLLKEAKKDYEEFKSFHPNENPLA